MAMQRIEVDDEVFAYLQARARPFVDTPNIVLRRELLGGRPGRKPRAPTGHGPGNGQGEILELPHGTPQALRQILEVLTLVAEGKSRSEATTAVARRHGVASQTVFDKYTRQLGLTAAEFDNLIAETELRKLRSLLRRKFSQCSSTIESTLSRSAA